MENESSEQIKNAVTRGEKISPARIFIFVILILGAATANEVYLPHSALQGEKKIEITAGLGSRKIGELLKKEGFIRSKWAFVSYASLKGQASDLKPGEYIFSDKTAIPEIVKTLVRGGANETVITIPEGWSAKNIAAYLEAKNIAKAKIFEQTVNAPDRFIFADAKNKFDFLKDKPASAGLEGYLFPDTYRVYKGAGEGDIILKMLGNFDRKFTAELKSAVVKNRRTIFETIIMASMVENEVISDEDRALVAGVLWKRLDRGMPLQVDATIKFIKDGRNVSDKEKNTNKISAEDLKINSPYNTYRYKGLPKGPISNPGMSAILAAIFPKKSVYFYYLSTPDGKTIFSRTLEEHNAAKAKYLK